MRIKIRKDKYPESYTIFRNLEIIEYNKSPISTLSQTLTLVGSKRKLSTQTMCHFATRRNIFPIGFFSASHADSSSVGASDIGHKFTVTIATGLGHGYHMYPTWIQVYLA